VTVAGSQLGQAFTSGLNRLGIAWLGVSSKRRVYTLTGSKEKQKTKTLLAKSEPRHWVEDPDLGYRFASLGTAVGSEEAVLLLMAEHMADRVRTLYLRAAKQTHRFGQFHSQNMNTNYGKTLLSSVVYLFENLLRFITPTPAQQPPGWIREKYLKVIVTLTGNPENPDYVIEFPGWLLDDYGLPDWDILC